MAVNITVLKNDGIYLPDAVETAQHFKLSYGVLDYSYVLERDSVSPDDYTVMYDADVIGRGFEFKEDGEKYSLTLPLPCTQRDVELFYDVVEWLCKKTDSDSFYQDDDRVSTKYLTYCKDGTLEACQTTVWEICDSIMRGDRDFYILYCALNPVVIGKQQRAEIIYLEDFGKMLEELQKWDVFYPSLRFYQGPQDKVFGSIFVPDNVPTVIPLEKFIPWDSDYEDCPWYVGMPGRALIKYEDFISRVKSLQQYDHNHGIISLDEEQIAYFQLNFNYDIEQGDYSPLVYWGKSIDSGHEYKIQRKKLPLDELCGYNHLAAYLRYRATNSLLSSEFVDQVGRDIVGAIAKNAFDVRDFIKNDKFIGGEICSRYFVPEFSLFTRQFYVFNSGKGFPAAVDNVALEYFGQEKYDSDEFKDEAYLFVPYGDEYCQSLWNAIDTAWKKFKNSRK